LALARLREVGQAVTLLLNFPLVTAMSSILLKLPDALKQRVIAMSRRKGMPPHAFMVGAIEQAVLSAEQRAAFVEDALAAQQEMLASGQGFDADEVHAYIASRTAGENPSRPTARTWRKRP
jgi:predicted transcriptional regulator